MLKLKYKIMVKKSEFGKLNKVDLLNALYHACAAFVFPFLGYLSIGELPTRPEVLILISVFLSAFFADVFKRSVTDSSGSIKKLKQND